eukprot:UN01010
MSMSSGTGDRKILNRKCTGKNRKNSKRPEQEYNQPAQRKRLYQSPLPSPQKLAFLQSDSSNFIFKLRSSNSIFELQSPRASFSRLFNFKLF